MEEILELMREYAKRHNIPHGVTLTLEEDGSGAIIMWSGGRDIFSFNDPEELIKKLKR